jgi:hypothetical protein
VVLFPKASGAPRPDKPISRRLYTPDTPKQNFLTVDRKPQCQQRLSAFKIAVVVLVARSNTLVDLNG